jgi:actin-related protein 3
VKEFQRFDNNPGKHMQRLNFTSSRGSKSTYGVDLGYEQFLGPELFFNPELYSPDFTKPLSEVVDESILASPIDSRRALYGRVVLSGGSTMFRNFHKRLQQDLKDRVDRRLGANHAKLLAGAKPGVTVGAPADMKVKVLSHDYQKFAVWLGGSMLASQDGFRKQVITKQQYAEEGPRCARGSSSFKFTSK